MTETMENSPLMELILKRRSVRKFISREVEPWKIRSMIEAARLAPSACNIQPWRFIAVIDESIRHALAEKAMGGLVPNSFAKEAPLLVVICADLNIITNRLAEKLKKINYHQIDIGIAGEHLVLRARELDLGTCWIGWFNEKEARKILKVPSPIRILSFIAVGYYNEEDLKGRASKKSLDEILFWNEYDMNSRNPG